MNIRSSINKVAATAALGFGLAATCVLPSLAQDKTITWGKPAEITGFDVHVAGTVASWEMYQMIYETLLAADENLNLEGALAESWEQTSPTSYVFKIRDGAAFSNGRAVTPADVIGSLERIKDPETASYWSHQLGDIAKMEAIDDHTVSVELAARQPPLLTALAPIPASMRPIEEV